MPPLRVGVLGSTGFTGSHVTIELLNRGHTVIGLSRSPAKIGKHERYEPREVDVEKVSFSELMGVLRGVDVLVSAYSAGGGGGGREVYVTFLETVRKIILAVKHTRTLQHFIFIGGAGSLLVPGTHESCIDDPSFLRAYRRAIGISPAFIQYMETRLGGIELTPFRAYRSARVAQENGAATSEDLKTIMAFEESADPDDRALHAIKAARAAYLFFDGNEGFQWSFCSPAALYRPGRKTGRCEVSGEEVVLRGERKEGESVFEGRLVGVSAGDLASAIADEVDGRRLVWKHWSAWGEIGEHEGGEDVFLRLAG